MHFKEDVKLHTLSWPLFGDVQDRGWKSVGSL